MKILLLLPFLYFATCTEGTRIDQVKNKALENLCNGETALKFLEQSLSAGREYVCLCQQGAKQSDQNLCKGTVNLNNGKDLITTCKTLFGKDGTTSNNDMRICKEMFNSVK